MASEDGIARLVGSHRLVTARLEEQIWSIKNQLEGQREEILQRASEESDKKLDVWKKAKVREEEAQ